YSPLPLASTYAAFHSIVAIVMALIARYRNNLGQHIEIPVVSAAQTLQILKFMLQSKPPTSWSTYQMFASPSMGIWKTADNTYIYLHIGIPRHFRNFILLLEKTGFSHEKAELERSINKKTKNDPAVMNSILEAIKIIKILRKLFLRKDGCYWEKTLSNEGLCCVRIRTVSEWIFSPQALDSGDIELVRDKRDQKKITIGPPLDFKNGSYINQSSPNVVLSKAEIIKKWQKKKKSNKKAENVRMPMENVKVLDISRIIAGPYAGRLFSEYGAEVLHVTFSQKHLSWEEPFHIAISGGKDSIIADLSSPQGKTAFQKIISEFKPDIIVYNFPKPLLLKYGLDPHSITRINPEIIYLSISAYNTKGPWKGRVGFEWNIQSACGLITKFTKRGKPKIYNIPIADMSSGLIACFGGALAYYRLLQTRRGNDVSTHLSMPSYYFLLEYLNSSNCFSKDINRFYKARDDWFLLSVNKEYLNKFDPIPELQFLTGLNETRYKNQIKKTLKKRTVHEWNEICKIAGCNKFIRIIRRKKIKTILKNELKKENPVFSFKNHFGVGKVLISNSPVQMNGTPIKSISPAHLFGMDTGKYHQKYGIPADSLQANIPKNKDTKNRLFKRILWVIGQIKWIFVILYK
ncbi:MAG: CoA transferase, partial [Chitinispirillia bacterium]